MIDAVKDGSLSRPLDQRRLATVRRTISGTVLVPGDAGYDDARSVWNGAIDRHPAVIVLAATPADAAAAIALARDESLPLSVRGGGHNVAGSAVAEGGVMLHLGAMRDVRLDPATRRVRVEPGVTLGDLDAATLPAGLAVPAGIVTHTGVAGLTLGGGIGWLMRRHGLTIDRLVAADMVLADGRHIRAAESGSGDPDLFWAIRGGGGNFGVITAFEFDAAPVGPEVTAGVLFFPIESASTVLRGYAEWAAAASDDVTTILTLRTMLPLPALPSHLHGRRVLAIGVCHVGGAADAERDVARLRDLGPVLGDTIARKPFLNHQRLFDPNVPWGHGYYWKSLNLPALTDPAIDLLAEHGAKATNAWSFTIMFQLGGAVARVASDATAYPDRGAAFALNINAVTPPGADRAEVDRAVGWCRRTYAALAPASTGATYVNFLMAEGEERVRAAYGPAYERLAAIKARVDPDNVFRSNQNIPPRARID